MYNKDISRRKKPTADTDTKNKLINIMSGFFFFYNELSTHF